LLELMVSSVVFTVLTGVLTFAWTRGARGWIYSTKLSARLSQVYVLRHRIEKELASSNLLTLDHSAGALSFASAYGVRNTIHSGRYFRIPQRAEPSWQKYCLYYWVPADLTIYSREVELPGGHSAQTQPVNLCAIDVGSGVRDLPFYCNGGKKVAELVSDFQVTVDLNSVHLEWECSEPYHGANVRKIRVRSATTVRN
jgi:hypothetical protein